MRHAADEGAQHGELYHVHAAQLRARGAQQHVARGEGRRGVRLVRVRVRVRVKG